MPGRKATTAERICIWQHLTKALTPVGDGVVAYTPGVRADGRVSTAASDADVAAIVNAELGVDYLNGNHVAHVRTEMFGRLERDEPEVSLAAATRIVNLEAEVARLRECIERLEARVDALTTTDRP